MTTDISERVTFPPDRRPDLPPRADTGPDPYRGSAILLVMVFALTLPGIFGLIALVQPAPPAAPWELEAAALGVDRRELIRGEAAFLASCAVCHGEDGRGIRNLGKPVRNSAFVQQHTDSELHALIVKGRSPSDPENTSGAAMPARGGQDLSDREIDQVVAYLRAIQDPDQPTASTAAWERQDQDGAPDEPTQIELTDHPGYDLFLASCAACHGQGGEGIESQGLPLTTSGFVRGKSDGELINFIKTGRPMWDANNVTGLDMPPKGGNPAITDDDLQLIVDYIRAIQRRALDE